MARQYKTGLIITGDASGGIRAIKATDQELGKLNQGFDRGRRHQRDYADQSRATGQALDQLRRLAAPVGAALAGMFAGRALQQQIDFGDQLHKTNLRIGASVEALSQYNYVAQLSGVQFSQLTTAWQRQTRRIAEAARGTGEASAALETLNLNAGELSRLAPEEQFERIAEALQGVSKESERVALAQKVWDSAGVSLLQITNQGTDAIRAMREEADRLGLTINQAAAESMAGLNDEMARLQAVATGVSRQVLAELVPAMTSTLQATSEWIDEMGGAAQILDTTKNVAAGLAALLAGRYAGSLATATAAKLAATHQAVLYQAALARMAGVSATAAGAQTALAAATRGAAGALALIGGPVGAAIVAAGAVYHFREELGLVPRTAETATSRVDGLTNSLDMNSQAALKNAKSMLEAERQLNSFRAAVLALDVAAQQQKVFEEYERLESMGGWGAVGAGPESEAQKRLRELREELHDVKQAGNLAGESLAKVENALDELEQQARTTTPIVRQYGEVTGGTAEETERAASGSDDFARSLAQLRNRLQPARAAQISMAQSMNTLTLAYASGRLSLSEYLDLLRLLQDEHMRAEDSTRDLVDATEAGADEMARAWERASDDIDRAFADAFAGAFDSFESFADQLENAFKRLLAELAYQATLRPIVVGFTQDMGGMLGIPGMGGGGGFGQTLAGFQGSGAGMAMGNAWRAFQGTGSTYAGQFGSSLAATSGGGLRAGFDSFAGSGFGSAALNIGGGLAGNLIGGQLFGRSQEQQIGSTLGSVAGGAMAGKFLAGLGSFAGPLGTLAGGVLGSALGSAFGSSPTDPSIRIATMGRGQMPAGQTGWEGHGSLYRQSVFGDVGFAASGTQRLNDLMSDEQRDNLLDSLVAMDAMVASAARGADDLDAMAAAVQDVSLRADDGQGIMQQLGDRTYAAIAAVDRAFADMLQSVGANADEMAQRTLQASQTLSLMGQSAQRLNLNLGELDRLSLTAADSLAMMAGGVEGLAAAQEQYYQAFFSETERAAHLQDDLTHALGEMGLALPETRDGFRDLVEAQDLNTDAGRETYVTLLQLAGGFDQLRTVQERLADATDEVADAAESYADQLDRLLGQLSDASRARRDQLRAELGAARGLHRARIDGLRAEQSAVREAYQSAADAQQQALEQQRSSIDQLRTAAEDAHAARMAALNEEISAASEAMRVSEGVISSLQGALDTLLGAQRETQLPRYQQAVTELSAMRGGNVDPDRLDRLLGVVTADTRGLYASFDAWDRQQGLANNLLADLEAETAQQLTIDELQLESLETQARRAERRHEALLEYYDDRFRSLDRWHEQTMAAMERERDTTLAGIAASIRHHEEQIAQAQTHHDREIARLDAQLDYWERQVQLAQGTYTATLSVGQAINGLSSALAASAITASASQTSTSGSSVPGFATGGIATGPMSGYPVELHGTEAVIPLSGGGVPVDLRGSFNIEPLVREIKELRRQVAKLEAYGYEQTKVQKKGLKIHDRWDRYGVPQGDEVNG